MRLRLQSLQGRLAARLAIVFVIATALVVGVILYQGSQAADELGNGQLLTRARELAHMVTLDAAGTARLELSPKLEQTFNTSAGIDLFLVQGEQGRVIAASSPEFAGATAQMPTPVSAEPVNFRLERFGSNGEDYYGLRTTLNSVAGDVLVTVARASDADALAYTLLWAFIRQIAWAIPLFAIATLGIAAWSIRRGLQPIRAISAQAAEISPTAMTVRLSGDDLPSDVAPLVRAFNQALDRLEEGFSVQRQFTANAAHELRTPLAILTAGLDSVGDSTAAEKLRADVARMNRLVDQLLRVARLDALPLDVANVINLTTTVSGVVEYLAPWAVAQGRNLGFEAPEEGVLVRGNADAIADAVRNIIENAVIHTPADTEVAISITQAGAVSIADHGPGISHADRAHVFERFWRGRSESSPGAGLGLAIVAEIARAHDTCVEIGENSRGGAVFTIRFIRAE
jgi:signal transduction histidine kinase